jgi:hypothetical protein
MEDLPPENLPALYTALRPIPGTTKLHCPQENIGAASVQLSPEDLSEPESAASKITV